MLGAFYINNRRSDRKQYVVLCQNLRQQKAQGDKEEFIESQWIEPSQLNNMVSKGEIDNVNLLAALQLYSAYLNRIAID
jgi:ADP-ribose pyrophosphatase